MLNTIDNNSKEYATSDAELISYGVRANKGIGQMLIRQILVNCIGLVGGVVLARTLSPTEFGIFGIATFFVTTLSLFGDCGFAALLVQRKKNYTNNDLQVAFTMQLLLLTLVSILIWNSAPYFQLLYSDLGGQEFIWLVRTIAVLAFFQSWRSISMLQLERRIEFGAVARVEVVEKLGYQLIAVILVVAGYGVWALVAATLFRGLIGAALSYFYAPWPVKLRWDLKTSSELICFGFPFQLNNITNSLSTWVTPILIGSLLGPTAVGLITWASGLASKPLAIMGSVNRVAFPLFSRLQEEPLELANSFKQYLITVMLLSGLIAAMLYAVADDLVPFIYGEKWSQAALLLVFFAFAMIFRVGNWITATLLRSSGEVNYVAKFGLVKLLFFSISALILTPFFGVYSVPLSQLLEGLLTLVAFNSRMSGELKFSALSSYRALLVPLVVTCLVIFILKDLLESIPYSFLYTSTTCLICYASAAWLAAPVSLRRKLLLFVDVLRARNVSKQSIG